MTLAHRMAQHRATEEEPPTKRGTVFGIFGRIFARRPAGVCSCGYAGPLDDVQPWPDLGITIGNCPRGGSTREAR